MPCLLLRAQSPRCCLIAAVIQPPHSKDRLFLPRTRRRPRQRLVVRMAEMVRVGSGGEPPEVAASVESDPILGGEASSGPRWETSRQAPLEAAMNRLMFSRAMKEFYFYELDSVSIWKHDAEIMWVLLGAVTNSLLSVILKKMLNHERPAPALRSDPGMPSSHAQSIFYAATMLTISLYYWLGTSYLTMILGPATLSMATYLSWLRVSQRLHTLNQVVVGAVAGSAFGVLWFVLWHSVVQDAFASSLLVQIAIILGASVFCVGFVIYMIRYWLKDE
ncbi:hypothetical protein U9M48_022274 [Paspalum notatum var. saurae]|uniref:Phosphatidic acid phosphatase type 2/haloperoxidase domain-containing protein n=1 Tax=Paspalum notatum var. saurae TaxID=547442 RepID=A0AAQ3TJI7_PASNO